MTPLPWQSCRIGLALVAGLMACAHVPAGAPVAQPPPADPAGEPARAHLQDEGVGYAFDLPPSAGFRPGSGRDGVVAAAPDGTLIRVFVEHFARPATEATCWDRLYERLPVNGEARPANPSELARQAKAGVVRNGRRLAIAPFPRGPSCLVVVVDGPEDSASAREASALAFATMRVTEPTGMARARLAFEAGIQLMDGDKRDAPEALERFEEALAADPSLKRAHLGAGLAAFFAGDAYARRAVAHFETALADRDDRQRDPEEALEPAQLKDALMYMGLALASLKEYAKAEQALAEAVARFPEDGVALYNFGCVLALGGDGDEAVRQLRAAFASDPDLRVHARTDADLDSLHTRPDWAEIVGVAP